MKIYSASTAIAATPDRVWEVLVEAAEYQDWDPGMIRVEGTLAPGEKVKFFTTFSPDRAFAVKVTTFEPGKRLVLTGGMPFGLFTSERTHTLTALEPNSTMASTSFTTEETFSGPLYPIFGKKIPDLTESFTAFCAGLKTHAEAGRS